MSSNANFVRGPDGKPVKKTVLPSANPSIGNVTAVGKVQINLNNIVVGGQTLSIEPESITFLNSTPGIATANKAVVLDDNKNIEQLNIVSTDELYVGGNQVTGLVNKGATVSNSIYMNDIQPGIGREGKIISSNDNGEVENVDIAADIVEYNGGVLDSDSNEIFATPLQSAYDLSVNTVNHQQYSHLKLKEVKNFYLLRTFNKVCYDSFRDINFATYIDTGTIDIFESVFKASGGTFSKNITYASTSGLTFTKQNMAYSPALDKYLIPVTTASQYSITFSPTGHPSTWTNASVWTSVTICTFTNQNVLMPYIKWSSLLNKFLTSAGGKVYQSNTGETWTELYTLSNATSTRTIICHDNYVMIVNPADTAILYTTDGTTWLTKTFTTALCTATNALVQYIPEVDLIISETNKIIASTFLSRPATGNTFNSVYTNFSISNAKYQISYLKDTNGKEFLINCPVNGSVGNAYNIYSLEKSLYVASDLGHWFSNQIIVFSYIIISSFASTVAVVYDFNEESIYRGFGDFTKKTAKKNVMIEPEVFLNFEVSTRVIVRDFQWVPDIKKYIAIGFANEAYATSEYSNVCLYHSDDLITFKFIRDLGRPNTNKIVVEETTGYVYGIEIGVNHLIILSEYGNTFISSTTTIGSVNHALYDRNSSFGVMMTSGGPAVMATGKIIIQNSLSGFGTGYIRAGYSAIYCTNGINSAWPVPFKGLLYVQTAQSGNANISNMPSIDYVTYIRNFKQSAVPNISWQSYANINYSVPIYIEQLGIFVRLRYNFNNDTTFKLSYTHQSDLNSETIPLWIEIPLQAPFFSYNSIWVPSLRYDSNSGRLYVVGNSDLQRTVISLNNLSLEDTPFMRNHLSAHYARDDSGNELYPLQTIYTPAINFNSIAYSCGVYAAVGLNTILSGSKLYASTSSTLSGDWKGIASSLTHFIVAGSGKIAVSTTTQPLSFQTNSIFPLVENWNYIHYSTQLDMWAVCADGKWAFSTDTTTWTALDVVGNWKSIKYSNGHWIAVGMNNVGYLKMITPAAPSTATVVEVTGDWRDSDFGGRWIITGFGKTAFSSGLNKPEGWTTFMLANGKNYNTATWVEGLSHFFLAGEHYSTFISNGNKLYHAPAQLTSGVSGKVCKFAMWSERYKGVIMVGNGCIMGTRMLGSGLDNSMIINSSIISSSNNPYSSTSFLKVSDYSESNFVNDGYLSAVTNVTNKEILSIKNNSTGGTVTAKQDNALITSLSVPKALAVEATILRINDVRVPDELDLGGLGIGSEGVAASGNYLSLDSNGSISNLAQVNCGGLIVGDEMYSSSIPSQLTGVTSGIVSADKAVKLDSNVSVTGVNDLASNGITIGGQEFVGESADESLIKWSVGTNSSMDGGNFNITDTCYSTTLDLFVATTSFNNNTNMAAEREKNFVLVSKDGVNWKKVYTGFNTGLMYAIPAEKMGSAVRTGIYFVTYAVGIVSNSYIAYTPDCVSFYWMDSQDYSGGSDMNMGYTTKMIFNDSVVNSPIVFKDPAVSALGVYIMYASSGGQSSSLKIGNVKNAIASGTQYYALAGNNAVNAANQVDMTPTSAFIGTGTINNCIFIQGLSGTGVNWDVVYVADSGRVLFKTASEANIALTTMQPNTTLVVDATCNFTCITYNPVSRRMLITATNGKIYISDAGSKSVWTQVTVPNASVLNVEWTRVRCAYEKGFLLIHANDADSKCNSKVCRVTNEGVFVETYTNIKRQLRLGAYGKGMYVVPILNDNVLGYKIMYSTDGIIWKYSLMQNRGLYRVIYVANLDKFFACYDKYIISSTDAITWNIIFTHPINGALCMELEYAENKNTLLGIFNGTSTQQLAYSTDTTNWNTSTIISNDNTNYQFMKYSEQLSRLIVCTYESNGTPAMYSDNFTTFTACVSLDSEVTNKPRGRNIMWVKEGSFLTMGNLWDGQWSSSDGISWTRNKVFMEYSSNATYGFSTFNIMNNIYVPGYGDIIVHSNGSKGNNFVRISKGAYKVIAPAESNSVEWIYSMLMYNSDKNQIVAYKQNEGTRKGDTFLTLDLEDFRNNKIEVPVDYLGKMNEDKIPISSYLSTNNIVTLANSTLDGGALNTVSLNNSIFTLTTATTSLDSTVCNNIFWINETEQFFILSNTGILTSKDGENWYYVLNNFNATSMCYSPSLNMLVAVRNNNAAGCLATSTNGINWTIRNATNNIILWNKVIWASGFNMFIACSGTMAAPASGDLSKIMTSVDGINWSAVDTGVSNRYRGHISMDYSPLYNIVVGITDSNTISFYSLDGVNWIYPTVTSSSYAPKDVVWIPSIKQFMCLYGQTAQAQLMATSDGIIMTNYYYTTTQISSVCYSSYTENYIMLFQEGTTYGQRFQARIVGEGFGSSTDMSGLVRGTWCNKFNNYFFVHTSGTRRVKKMADSRFIASYKPDPINSTVWKNVCWSPELSIFVAIAESGNSQIMISANGSQWSNVDYYNSGMKFRGICWSPQLSLFVAVSRNGIRKVITSPDGINWTERSTPGNAITGGQWTSVCWSPELALFVAVSYTGSDKIMTSSDGINWVLRSFATDRFNTVCWSPELSLFVAMGESATAKSNDGVNWFVSMSTTSTSVQSMCWSPVLKMFVAVCSSGSRIITSVDGEIWTSNTTFVDTITPYSVVWASSKFVVCGTQANGYGFVAESKDGVVWVQSYSTNSAYSFKSIDYSPSLNEYVILADAGTDRILNITNASTSTLSTSPFTSLNYKLSLNIVESNPAPTTVNWTDVVYATAYSAYFAVANTGTTGQKACTSADGVSWTNRNPTTDGAWSSICYGEFATTFKVVAGNAGTGTYGFLIARDATTWNVSGPGITNVSSVCASEELKMFVAVRSTGTSRVVTSGDGSTWTLSASADENSSWSSVCWSPGLRLFVGLATTGANRLMTSVNGTTWTLRTLSDGLENCAWVNVCWSERLRMFLAISSSEDHKMMKSVNGTTWTPVASSSFTSSLKKIIWCYGKGMFLGLLSAGNDRLLYSYDGVTWTIFSSIHNTMDWTSIGWNTLTSTAIVTSNISPTSSKFMNVTMSPSPVSSIRSITSVDDTTSAWQSLAFSQSLNVYVSVASAGTNRIMTSTDAITWIAPTVLAEVNTTTWSSICWSQELSLFVAVASAGTNRVMTSADAITWVVVTSAVANLFTWRSVCWSPGVSLFVAVANGGTGNRVMTSVDGMEWVGQAASSNTNGWLNVCWSPVASRFVAVADSGTGRIMWSPNGTTWTAATMPSTTDSNMWKCVCWASGLNQFTAVSETGSGATKVITSKDGAIWDLSLSTSYINFSYVAWAPSVSLFVGVALSGTARLMTSKDGGTWKYNTSSNNLNEWSSILWNPASERFVAVARLGTNRVMNILVDRNNITVSYPTYTPPADFSVTYNSKTDTTLASLNTYTSYVSANETNVWRGICWSQELSLFVAISNTGTNRVMTSSNGIDWVARTSANEGNQWYSVCWSPGLSLFVCVSATGTSRVMTSPDGINWTPRTSANEGQFWNYVCWSPQLSLLVAVAGDSANRVMTSVNGINWTSRTSAGEANLWRSVCWSPELSIFVAVASSGTNRVMTSPNGIDWSPRVSSGETNSWNSVCWSSYLSIFVAIASSGTSRVMTSPDGITWTPRTSADEAGSWSSVCWSSDLNMFMAVSANGTNKVMTSANGITWAATASGSNGGSDICYSPGFRKFVAVSGNGTNRVMNINETPLLKYKITTSSNVTAVCEAVCWSPSLSLFVGMCNSGTNRVVTSSDGITWTPRTSADPSSYGVDICWSPELSLFVTVLGVGARRIMTSSNGLNWTLLTEPSNGATNDWRGVCWSPQLSLFVVVGGTGTQRVMTSPDGINWTLRNHAGGDVYWISVCWSPQLSLFVAVAMSGTGNKVMTSSNGINWTARTSGNDANYWKCVCWSPELRMFVATAIMGSNRAMTSIDGINWAVRALPNDASGWDSCIWSTVLKVFIAFSYEGTQRVMLSPNGINWQTSTSLDSLSMYSLCESPQLNKVISITGAATNNVAEITRMPYSITYSTSISSVVRPTPPATAANIWQSMCWSKDLGIFVAFSTQGTNRVMTSADGANWTLRPSIAMDVNQWTDVCWSPKLKIFVAMSYSGTRKVGISYDGIRWETVLSGNEANGWYSVCWSEELSMFVAVAISGTNRVMYSYNGINWINVASAIEGNQWYSVCWSPKLSMFMAVSYTGTTSSAMYSRNGYYWTSSGTLAIGNGWRTVDWSPALNMFVAVANTGTNRFAYSYDGLSWTTIASPTETSAWTSVKWLPEVKTFIAISTAGEVAESYNGTTWQITQKQTDSFYGIAWSPLLKKVVAGVTVVSKNLLVLNIVNSPIETELASTAYQQLGTVVTNLSPGTGQTTPARPIDVAYSNSLNIYTAVCDQGTFKLLYSYNGSDWCFDTQASSTLNTTVWSRVCWSASWGMFIAVASSGTDRIAVSTNGKTWSAVAPTGVDKSWTSIVSRETNVDAGITAMVVALSSTGDVLRSVNGLDWTVTASGNASEWYSVVWNQTLSKFTAVSSSTTNRIMNSVDGLTWTTTTFNLAGSRSIAWSPSLSLYVAVSITASANSIHTSVDGVTWTARTLIDTPNFYMTSTFASTCVEWIPELEMFIATCYPGSYSSYALLSKDGINWVARVIIPHLSVATTLCKWNSFKQELICIKQTSIDYGVIIVKLSSLPTLSLPYRVKWDLLWVKGIQMFVAMKKVNPVSNYTQFYLSTDGKSWSADTTNFVSHIAADALLSITSYTEIPQWDMLVTCKNSNYLQTISQNGVQQLNIGSPINCIYYSSVLKCLIAGVNNSNTIGLINLFRDGTLGNSIYNTLPVNLIIKEICICNGNHIIISSGTTSYYYSYDMAKFESSTLPFADEWHFASRKVRGYELEVVAVSAGGIIIRSVDGISWTTVKNYNVLESTGSRKFSNIKYIEELEVWVAVDEAKKINSCVYSSDGINWVDVDMPSAVSLCDVAFSSSVDGFVFLTLPDDASGPVTTLATLPKVATCYNSMKVDGFNISSNGGIYTGNTVSNTFLSNTLETMPLLALATDSAYKPSTSTWTINSDRRLKEEIENMDIDECLNMLERLELKYYKWKDEFVDAVGVEDKHKLGFIAQEVEEVVPDAIYNLGDIHGVHNAKSVNYDQLIAILYGAIQALMSRYEKLKTELES